MEFNQCQTQLILLYKEGLTGCWHEFLAYRILYYIFNGSVLDSSYLLGSLTPDDYAHPAVQHALQVRHIRKMSNMCTNYPFRPVV